MKREKNIFPLEDRSWSMQVNLDYVYHFSDPWFLIRILFYFNSTSTNWFCSFSGKILDDEKKIGEYKIEEKNFVVVMVTKVSYCCRMFVLLRVCELDLTWLLDQEIARYT